jgi:hypothetical protein
LCGINLSAQHQFSVGFGLGNAVKTAATQLSESFGNKKVGFDVSLGYSKTNHYAAYLEYTFAHVTSSESTSTNDVNSLDIVHQPKFKLLYAPLGQSSLQHEIGGSLTSNNLNYKRTIVSTDAFGNTYQKEHSQQLNTFGLGATYRLNSKLNRFTFVWETEFGKILDDNIMNKVQYIHGYGLPIGGYGFYLNMDIELYYSLNKVEYNNQPTKQGSKTYEFK